MEVGARRRVPAAAQGHAPGRDAGLGCAGIWHDRGHAGLRLPRLPVARQPWCAHDLLHGGVGAARHARWLCVRSHLQELRRGEVEVQHLADLYAVPCVSSLFAFSFFLKFYFRKI